MFGEGITAIRCPSCSRTMPLTIKCRADHKCPSVVGGGSTLVIDPKGVVMFAAAAQRSSDFRLDSFEDISFLDPGKKKIARENSVARLDRFPLFLKKPHLRHLGAATVASQ